MNTETLTLKQFATELIADLENPQLGGQKGAAYEYFKNFLPEGTSKQKFNAIVKKAEFTWDFAEAIFQTEDITIGAPEAASEAQAAHNFGPRTAAEARMADAIDPNGQPDSGIVTDDGTLPPAIPNFESFQQRRPIRKPDVRSIEGKVLDPRATRLQEADPALMEQFQMYLESIGWQPPVTANSGVDRTHLGRPLPPAQPAPQPRRGVRVSQQPPPQPRRPIMGNNFNVPRRITR